MTPVHSIIIASVLVITATASMAHAEMILFNDIAPVVKYWPGFENNTNDDNRDTIGRPDLVGGAFSIEGQSVTGIHLNYASTHRWLIPGDWFFDVDSDNNWDYVLHNNIGGVELGPYGSADTYALYSVGFDFAINTPLGDGDNPSPYVTAFAGGQGHREDHPVQANIEAGLFDFSLIKTIDFTGWDYSRYGPYSVTWSDFSIPIGPAGDMEFTYGFAMTCANDVLYGTVHAPEPSTFLLLFGGLIGLAGCVMHNRRQNQQLS